jgi:hypothetical protein
MDDEPQPFDLAFAAEKLERSAASVRTMLCSVSTLREVNPAF